MHDALIVVLISLVSAFVSEGISWILIYRTEEYQRLKKQVDLLQAKVDKKKSESKEAAAGGGGGKDGAAKKAGALEEQLTQRNRDLSMKKMKSTFFVGFILLGVFGLLNSLFEGQAVAKLPFEPFGIVQSMSHRGLAGSDPTDCSMTFIYVLCSISIRAHVQKALGWSPVQSGPSMFQMPEQK